VRVLHLWRLAVPLEIHRRQTTSVLTAQDLLRLRDRRPHHLPADGLRGRRRAPGRRLKGANTRVAPRPRAAVRGGGARAGTIANVAFSLLYLAVGALLDALVRSRRDLDGKDIELVVLSHEPRGAAPPARATEASRYRSRPAHDGGPPSPTHRAARARSLRRRRCVAIGRSCAASGGSRPASADARPCRLRSGPEGCQNAGLPGNVGVAGGP